MWTLLEKKKKKGPIKSHGCNIYSLMHLAGLALGVRVCFRRVCALEWRVQRDKVREREREREAEGEKERERERCCTCARSPEKKS